MTYTPMQLTLLLAAVRGATLRVHWCSSDSGAVAALVDDEIVKAYRRSTFNTVADHFIKSRHLAAPINADEYVLRPDVHERLKDRVLTPRERARLRRKAAA